MKIPSFHARSIRAHLFWTYAALVTVLVVALMALAELAASRIVFDGAQRELEQLGRRTQEQLLRFQEPARAWLEATANDPHERRHRSETRGKRAPMSRAFQRREAFLKRRPGRVRDPRVVVALVDADRVLHVSRRLVDRRRDRARRRVGLLPFVDRAGLEMHSARMLLTRLRPEPRGEARKCLVCT